jgi:DNA-binding SARP family transcriptional activator/alpha-beta hydrolase superfamily lysophospholipase
MVRVSMARVSALAVDASVETTVESAGTRRLKAGGGVRPAFRLGVLGPLAVTSGGESLALPKSRKTRALLAYVALASGPVRRDRLCELFWEAPDDPRGSLRWSLSKLRPVANADGIERLAADADAVVWTAPEALDLHAVEAASTAGFGGLALKRLKELAALFRGELAEGLDLPEHDVFQRWLTAERERARSLRASLLSTLIARLEGKPGDALPYAGTLAELEPYEESVHLRLMTLHRRLGREKQARQAYDAGVRTLREIGRPTAALDAAWRASSSKRSTGEPPTTDQPASAAAQTPLEHEIRFCRAADGTRIAYASVGRGPPLVKTANWLNHLEYDWESPVWRHAFRAFAKEHTFLRYDARGNGLSDWSAEDLSLDAQVSDLEAVAEATGLDRFPLLAMSQGCAIAIEYAVRHPERISRLVLLGGYARGWRVGSPPDMIAEREAELTFMRTGWGRDNPAFRQIFTSLFIPGATPEQMQWLNELQRLTTTGETAARIMRAFSTADVTRRLGQVRTPTLVLHARGDQRVAFARGLELAAGIPGARFVALESDNHLLLEQDPAWPRFWTEVSRFLAEERAA